MYIVLMIPATYLMGLQDIQRKFLIQVGKSHIQMKTQIQATFLHIVVNYLFIFKLE